MITIEYMIKDYQPHEEGQDVQNILSTNKSKFLEFHSGQGSITIQFPKSKIEEISLCLGSSATVQIGAFNSPDQKDLVYLIESQESVVSEKLIKYSSNLFASQKDTKFSYAKLDISSMSSNGSLKIFYWILKSPRDAGSSPPRSNYVPVNTRFFYSSPPAKRTLEISKNPKTDLSNPIQRYDSKPIAYDHEEIPRKRKLDYDTPRVSRNPIENRIGINNKIRSENKNQEDKAINIEDGETIAEQNSIFQDIQNRKQRVLRSHTQKKEPTNSYKNVLNNCLVSAAVQDPGKSIMISELCESLGAIYIEELDRSVEYLVSDGTNTRKMDEARQLGIKIVAIDWLIFCLSKRKHIDDETLLFN